MLSEALAWCFKRLRASDQSVAQLRGGLIAKGFEEEIVAKSVAWLHQRGLINDEALAIRKVETAQSRRKVGLLAAQAELEKLGVDEAARTEALAQWSPEQEIDQARRLLDVKLKPGDGPVRAARLLAGRGHGEDLIRTLLEERFPDWEVQQF